MPDNYETNQDLENNVENEEVEYEYDEDYDYEEEEDEGYSIPKILVAVLLLVVIGTIFIIVNQQRRTRQAVAMLRSEKEQVNRELSEMIEKYSLTKDDNDNLSDDLKEEQSRLIAFRDSVMKLDKRDFNKNKSVANRIEKFKRESSINLRTKSKTTDTKVTSSENSASLDMPGVKVTIAEDEKDNNTSGAKSNISGKSSEDNDAKTVASKNEASTKNDNTASKSTKPSAPTSNTTASFARVEVPPTYPGCSGPPKQRKACFEKKVTSLVAKKFNPSVASDLESGKHRVWVAFTVDKFGNVTNIQASAGKGKYKEKLEKEAVDATKKLPKMQAARQNGVPVPVKFQFPIGFMIE